MRQWSLRECLRLTDAVRAEAARARRIEASTLCGFRVHTLPQMLERTRHAARRPSDESLSRAARLLLAAQVLDDPRDAIVLDADPLEVLEHAWDSAASALLEKEGVEAFPLPHVAPMGCFDAVPTLLHYALVELLKNALVHGSGSVAVSVVGSTANAALLRISNPAPLPPPQPRWFVTAKPVGDAETHYGYSGNHGAVLSGVGAGSSVARCCLDISGGSSVHWQWADGTAEAVVTLWRSGTRLCI